MKKLRSRIKLFLLFSLITVLCLFVFACSKKEGSSEKSLNIYIDVKDNQSTSIIKFLTDEYKKSKSDLKINITNTLGKDNTVVEDISKGNVADVLFTSRNNMLELCKKGLLGEMGEAYEKNKFGDRYYKIVSSYGRIGDKYYGIGLIPYSIEVLYNKNELSRLKMSQISKPADLYSALKILNQNSVRIPVVLPENMDINSGLATIFSSNNVKLSSLEKIYDNSKTEYNNLTGMQNIFDDLNYVVKSSNISRNTFEMGNDNTVESFITGSVPVIICNSYYNTNLNSADTNKIGIVDNYSILRGDKSNIPVIINAIMCIPTNNKNSSEVADFVKYAYSDEFQNKLVKKGFITGNIKANENVKGLGKIMAKHLQSSDDNSIDIIYNLPKKFQSEISSKVEAILSGTYTKKEWQDIVDKLFK